MTIGRQILVITILLTAFSPSTFAQQATQTDPAHATPPPAGPETPTVKPAVFSQLPEGNSVWVVHLTRTGGFAGISIALTLTSEGKFACPACTNQTISRTLSQRDLRSVTPSFNFASVADGNTAAIPTPVSEPLFTMCSDCISTRITIQRRDSAGKIETYTRSWNDVSVSTVQPEFIKLADTILSLAKK